MIQWHNNDLLTNPQRVQMSRSETLPLGWDMTAILDEGDDITSPVITVTKVKPGPIIDVTDDAVSGAAFVDQNIVTQTIDGAALTRGHLYEILVTFEAATGKNISVMTMLECLA